MIRRTPTSTLFPYMTLFRSRCRSGSSAPAAGESARSKREAGRHEVSHPPLRSGLHNGGRAQLSRHPSRSEEHTSELQSRRDLVCRLLLEKKKHFNIANTVLY